MTEQEKIIELFDISKFSNLGEIEIEEKFQNIAMKLFNNYQIIKGNTIYEFLEIEFYLYSPTHPDIITYPRNAKAGDWFFHQSGVDICFGPCKLNTKKKNEKKKELDIISKDSYFGGILIRCIKKEDQIIQGPLKCCWELFDQFSAITKEAIQYPHIVEKTDIHNFTAEGFKRVFNFSNRDNKINELNKKFEIEDFSDDSFKNWEEKKYRFKRIEKINNSTLESESRSQ